MKIGKSYRLADAAENRVSTKAGKSAMEAAKEWILRDAVKDNILMMQYGKSMLRHYVDDNEWDIDYQTNAMNGYGNETSAKKYAERIGKLSTKVLDEKSNAIRLNELGKYLWKNRFGKRDDDPMKSILFLIKSYEQCLADDGIVMDYQYVQLSISKNGNESSLRKAAKDQMKKIKDHLVKNCRGYYVDDKAIEFVTDMLDDMLDMQGNKVVYDKLSDEAYIKFAHQIAGMLMDARIVVDCTQNQLVKAMKLCNKESGKPSEDSRERFLRDKMDDAPKIRDWIIEQIKEYKKRKRA